MVGGGRGVRSRTSPRPLARGSETDRLPESTGGGPPSLDAGLRDRGGGRADLRPSSLRPSARHAAVRQSIGEPDPFKLRRRATSYGKVGESVRRCLHRRGGVRPHRHMGGDEHQAGRRSRIVPADGRVGRSRPASGELRGPPDHPGRVRRAAGGPEPPSAQTPYPRPGGDFNLVGSRPSPHTRRKPSTVYEIGVSKSTGRLVWHTRRIIRPRSYRSSTGARSSRRGAGAAGEPTLLILHTPGMGGLGAKEGRRWRLGLTMQGGRKPRRRGSFGVIILPSGWPSDSWR